MNNAQIKALLNATWPARETSTIGSFTYRSNCGGGSRVSAASCEGEFDISSLAAIEQRFKEDHRQPLFQVWDGEDALQDALATKRYTIKDETICLSAPVSAFADPPLYQGFPTDHPIASHRHIWNEGGIGPDRLAVMERVSAPKTYLLGRIGETPAATAFLAKHETAVMLHALEVSHSCRRQGVGRLMMEYAALWAKSQGAERLCVLVTTANAGALKLYEGLGMTQIARYHYRAGPAITSS